MGQARPFELKGWHVLASVLGFFAVVIGANAVFIIAAVKTFPGEVVPKSYVQGLEYNETLADRASQAKLGWRAEASISATAEGPALIIAIRDADGRPLTGLSLSGELRRPADDDQDRSLTFAPLGDGRYVAATPDLAQGIWRLKVLAARGGDHLVIGGELIWTP